MTTTIQKEKSSSDFKVIFGRSRSLDSPIPLFTALVVPSNDKWNDFGFRTLVEVHVSLPEGLTVLGAHLGYVTSAQDEPDDVRKLDDMLQDSSEFTIAADDSQKFFMMLPSLGDYRRVVGGMGIETAKKLLIALRDIVALTELQPKSNIPKLAVKTKVFQKSFVRTSESFFAFKNAGSILRGLEAEQFRRMSKDILMSFQLPGRGNKHQLKFQFDHDADLPKRIAVVIGKNGVGKSQTLSRIVQAALSGSSRYLSEGDGKSRVLMNRLLAFAPTNESASAFPSERRKNAKVWYKRLSLNRGGKTRRGEGVADTVLQVARSQETIGESSRWRIFISAVRAISDWDQIALLAKDKVRDPMPLEALHRSGSEDALLDVFASIDLGKDPVRVVERKTYPLSSGEISLLRFAAQASLYIENGSLLLLDEPETHLHPNFISHFVAVLDNMLAQTGSAAVIATHSAYFVREVFREQVTVLRIDGDGNVVTEPLRLQTFGADVGSISYFVFGEDEPSKLASEVEKRLLARYQTWEQLYSDYKNDLSPEMLGTLRLALESGGRHE
ncbi:ATP-binding protein [Burkholderia sp. Bp8963]|uniref:AAA family ATPase n=1 Tax=Burkholderia sp. Bp8963 TaxID=2184547 RepID=UPI000F5B05A1|nr:AAA family ATPase [Burkholderia sp. Bp8963]RQS76176.1 ATP-binding protein [Burkholderia sp. Bp8963]